MEQTDQIQMNFGNSSENSTREKNALDQLFAEVQMYRKGSNFEELFKFLKMFRYVAPYNAFLVHMQKPGAEYVATIRDWKKRFNRNIKPDARPLVTLVPFGPVRFVYDLGDTEGPDPFPKELLDPFGVDGTLPHEALSKSYR